MGRLHNNKLQAQRDYLRTRTHENRSIFNHHRDIFQREFKEFKRKNTYDRLYRAKDNPRELWKEINITIGKPKSNNATIDTLVDDQGNTISGPQEAANKLNDFFTNIGKNIQLGYPMYL
jgi:hypothetical protein